MMSRNIAIALAILAVLALALVAQAAIAAPVDMPTMHRGHGAMVARGVFDQLGLTPDQKAKLASIQKDFQAQRLAVIGDKSLTPDARKARLRDIRSNERAQINQVLTPAQQQQLRDQMKARKAQWFQKKSEALGLTADQQAQIKSIKESSKAELKAVRADQTLSPDARAAKIKEIRTAAKDKIMQVLTPEQRAKMEARHGSKSKGLE